MRSDALSQVKGFPRHRFAAKEERQRHEERKAFAIVKTPLFIPVKAVIYHTLGEVFSASLALSSLNPYVNIYIYLYLYVCDDDLIKYIKI